MRRAAIFLPILFGAWSCSSSSTSTTAPTSDKCVVSAAASTHSFSSSGGAGTVSVDTSRECTWTLSSDASWIVPDRTEGQGAASVAFRVGTNSTPAARHAGLVVESTRIQVDQEGAPCRFDVAPSAVAMQPAGGSVSIGVTAMSGCTWTARAVDSWIAIANGGSGNGTGVVQLTVAANTGTARRGSAVVAGQTVTIDEQPAPASPTPTPAPPTPAPSPSPTPPTPTPAPPTPTPPAPTPPPPSPTPTPPPPPPPPPDEGKKVKVEGTVSSLHGSCPEVTFAVDDATVLTDRGTKYHGGKCSDLDDGQRVDVEGKRQADGRVLAERIDLKGEK